MYCLLKLKIVKISFKKFIDTNFEKKKQNKDLNLRKN